MISFSPYDRMIRQESDYLEFEKIRDHEIEWMKFCSKRLDLEDLIVVKDEDIEDVIHFLLDHLSFRYLSIGSFE
jgi:hypothetical protein